MFEEALAESTFGATQSSSPHSGGRRDKERGGSGSGDRERGGPRKRGGGSHNNRGRYAGHDDYDE